MRDTLLSILPPLLIYVAVDFTSVIFEYNFLLLALLRSLLLIVSLFIIYKLVFIKFRHTSSTIWSKFALLATSLLSIIIVLEIVLTFIPKSHAFSQSLASRVWKSYYWNDQLNTFGYRDQEIAEKGEAKTKIALVGDSFVSGHGIKKTEDRFGNILESKIPNAAVYNIALNGANTVDELKMLMSFPVKPNYIVLSYFGNDIEGTALRMGRAPKYAVKRNAFTSYTIEHSFLIGFIHSLYSSELNIMANSYTDFLEMAYQDQTIFQQHLKELSQFMAIAQQYGIELYVVVFPFLSDMDASQRIYGRKIESFFQNNGFKALNVADILEKYPTSMLIVNKQDHHPNEFANRVVAEQLYTLINGK